MTFTPVDPTVDSQARWNAARIAWATAHDCRIDADGNLHRRPVASDAMRRKTLTTDPEAFRVDPTNYFLVSAIPDGEGLEEGRSVEMYQLLTLPAPAWPAKLAAWSSDWDANGFSTSDPPGPG